MNIPKSQLRHLADLLEMMPQDDRFDNHTLVMANDLKARIRREVELQDLADKEVRHA